MSQYSEDEFEDDFEEEPAQDAPEAAPAPAPEPQAPAFGIGDHVEAQAYDEPDWYPGVVQRVHANGRVDIKYEDGDFEAEVRPAKVRRTPFPAAAAESSSSDDEEEGEPEPEPQQPEPEADPQPQQPQDHGFSVGDRVEARAFGEDDWYPGVVAVEQPLGVDYDDGDRERNMRAEDVRALDVSDSEDSAGEEPEVEVEVEEAEAAAAAAAAEQKKPGPQYRTVLDAEEHDDRHSAVTLPLLVSQLFHADLRQRYDAYVELGRRTRSSRLMQARVGEDMAAPQDARPGKPTALHAAFRDMASGDRGLRIAAARLLCDLAYGSAANQHFMQQQNGLTVGQVRLFAVPQCFGSEYEARCAKTGQEPSPNGLVRYLQELVRAHSPPLCAHAALPEVWSYPDAASSALPLTADPALTLLGFYRGCLRPAHPAAALIGACSLAERKQLAQLKELCRSTQQQQQMVDMDALRRSVRDLRLSGTAQALARLPAFLHGSGDAKSKQQAAPKIVEPETAELWLAPGIAEEPVVAWADLAGYCAVRLHEEHICRHVGALVQGFLRRAFKQFAADDGCTCCAPRGPLLDAFQRSRDVPEALKPALTAVLTAVYDDLHTCATRVSYAQFTASLRRALSGRRKKAAAAAAAAAASSSSPVAESPRGGKSRPARQVANWQRALIELEAKIWRRAQQKASLRRTAAWKRQERQLMAQREDLQAKLKQATEVLRDQDPMLVPVSADVEAFEQRQAVELARKQRDTAEQVRRNKRYLDGVAEQKRVLLEQRLEAEADRLRSWGEHQAETKRQRKEAEQLRHLGARSHRDRLKKEQEARHRAMEDRLERQRRDADAADARRRAEQKRAHDRLMEQLRRGGGKRAAQAAAAKRRRQQLRSAPMRVSDAQRRERARQASAELRSKSGLAVSARTRAEAFSRQVKAAGLHTAVPRRPQSARARLGMYRAPARSQRPQSAAAPPTPGAAAAAAGPATTSPRRPRSAAPTARPQSARPQRRPMSAAPVVRPQSAVSTGSAGTGAGGGGTVTNRFPLSKMSHRVAKAVQAHMNEKQLAEDLRLKFLEFAEEFATAVVQKGDLQRLLEDCGMLVTPDGLTHAARELITPSGKVRWHTFERWWRERTATEDPNLFTLLPRARAGGQLPESGEDGYQGCCWRNGRFHACKFHSTEPPRRVAAARAPRAEAGGAAGGGEAAEGGLPGKAPGKAPLLEFREKVGRRAV